MLVFLRGWAFFCNFEAVKTSKMLILLVAVLLCGCSRPAAKAEQGGDAVALTQVNFDADSAYAYIAKQVAFGSRAPETAAHADCARWLAAELARHGADTVIVQTAMLEDFGAMSNIMGRFNLAASRRVLLLAHWDSRPWADEDPEILNRTTPIDGANDGASGVGVLLEIARQCGIFSPSVGVDVLFVDAEDAGVEGDDESWARGTQYWVANMPEESMPLPDYVVLLDMVGGQDAKFPREMFSDIYAGALNSRVWGIASRLGLASRFPDRRGGAVNDDHLPFLSVGIPAIDIIETDNPQTGSFNPTWHTLNDNLEHIDRQTLGDVGRVVATLIYSEPDK